MTVQKYKSVDEMPTAPMIERSPKENLASAFELSRTCVAFSPLRFPAGVHVNRDIESARQRREGWTRAMTVAIEVVVKPTSCP